MNKLMKIIGTVAVINIVARLLGFLREIVIGYQYGTSTMADAIAMAYTIPNFIYLVVGGAVTTAFISVYHSTKSDKESFVRKSLTTILFAAVVITVLIMLMTDPLLTLFFKELDADNYLIVRNLFLWMMPSTIILVLSTWMSGLLNVNGFFNLSSVAILLYNLGFLVIGVLLTSSLGPESYGVGALVAAIMMGGFLYIGLRKSQLYSLKPSLKMSADVKRLWVIALPILFGGASLQFYIIIHKIVAATLGEGAISSVNYASKLTGFPQAILMTAVTTVIYPLLSKKEGAGESEAVRALYRKGLRYLVILLIPATVIAYFLAEPLVRIVFGYGEMTEASIQLIVPIFRVFTFSMFFLAANTYITRFYYAKGNSVVPVIFSLINVFGVNLIIIYVMLDSFGVSAIAYGTVISAAVNFGMLAIYARLKWDL